jgi:hypothetical protein
VPYHVHTHFGAGALSVIVETAREALAKAAEFFEDGYREVISKICWETFWTALW